MKHTIIAASLVACAGLSQAAAGDYASVQVDHVKDSKSGAVSTAQYFRAGTAAYGLNLDAQVRTAVFSKGGMLNSVEFTAGKGLGPINVFGGLGHDNGFNGAKGGSYDYGLVGVSAGYGIGKAYGFGGVKTRLNWEASNPRQTVAFAGVSYALTKSLSVDADWSKSYGNIKEDAIGLGMRVSF